VIILHDCPSVSGGFRHLFFKSLKQAAQAKKPLAQKKPAKQHDAGVHIGSTSVKKPHAITAIVTISIASISADK
jgi:hypothetical protein